MFTKEHDTVYATNYLEKLSLGGAVTTKKTKPSPENTNAKQASLASSSGWESVGDRRLSTGTQLKGGYYKGSTRIPPIKGTGK